MSKSSEELSTFSDSCVLSKISKNINDNCLPHKSKHDLLNSSSSVSSSSNISSSISSSSDSSSSNSSSSNSSSSNSSSSNSSSSNSSSSNSSSSNSSSSDSSSSDSSSSNSSSSNSSSSNSSSSNSSCDSSKKTNCSVETIDCKLLHKIHIDVAVVCQDFNGIELMDCKDHIINLDEIPIKMELFQMIFYPYKENFGLNKDFFIQNTKLLTFISFFPEFRSINGKKFYLLEALISNIEADLSMSRNCFTKDSLVELSNEITSIKTLLDIKCCSVLSSLTWSNILDIIKNYNLIQDNVIPVLIVNVVFKTPTPGVKDTIVRFQYKIC